jgi:D-alanyl-D-alanine carboxypeptidase
MRRGSAGARRGLRLGALALAVIMGSITIASDPADARSRRKRHSGKRQHAAQSYNPPYADIVVDAKTGTVLRQTNPDSLRHPASLTKIMTLYLLFERLEAGTVKLDSRLDVSQSASNQAPTKLGLKPGQSIAVEDAIKALVTKSANDAAVVIAEALAGSEDEFARLMTRKARALGMRHTVYRNASGLPNDEQITTARDQALLGIAIQERFPHRYRYFSTRSFVYRGNAMRNHNRLLGKVEGVDGIKTGYTRASGFNLVTSVHRNNRHIVAVVLGGRSGGWRDARMRDLIETQIAKASTKGTVTRMAEVPLPKPEPAAGHQLAAAADTPLPLEQPAQAIESTAAIPSPPPESNSPMKPVQVKTVAVKLVPAEPKSNPPPTPVPAEIAAAEKMRPPSQDTGTSPQSPAGDSPSRNASAPTSEKAKDQISVRQIKRRGWAIQVGAFEDEKDAKERLSSAQSTAARLLAKADGYTERTTKGDKTYYRVRFAGLNRERAKAICRKLKRNDMACMALKF